MAKRKLRTKAQRDFFDGFARSIVTQGIFLGAHADGKELTEEQVAYVEQVVSNADLDDLADQAGELFMSKVPFANIVKVDAFMSKLETKEVLTAAMQTGEALQNTVEGVMIDLFSPKE